MRVRRSVLGPAALLSATALMASLNGQSASAAPQDEPPGPGTSFYSEVLPATVPEQCLFLQRAHRPTSNREWSGLPATSDGDLSEEPLPGVRTTSGERDRMIEVAETQDTVAQADLEEIVGHELGEAYISTYWVPSTGFVVSYAGESDLDVEQAIEARAGVDPAHLSTSRVDRGVPRSTFMRNLDVINKRARELGGLGMSETFLDESCGHLVLYAHLDSDPSRLEQVLRTHIDPDHFSIVHFDDLDDVNFEGARTDHQNPYVGGSRISTNGVSCTSSIGWRKPTAGGTELWAVTAAHCMGSMTPDPRANYWDLFTVQRAWNQGGQQLNNVSGLTSYVIYGGQGDLAVTRLDSSYSALPRTIYATLSSPLGADLMKIMDWWQWDPSQDVAGDQGVPGYAGDWVCHSGQTQTNALCGSLLTRRLTQTGTSTITGLWSHFHDIRRASPTHRGGDSGGTVWEQEADGDRWLTGVSRGPGGEFGGFLTYSHVSYVKTKIGLASPVGMS